MPSDDLLCVGRLRCCSQRHLNIRGLLVWWCRRCCHRRLLEQRDCTPGQTAAARSDRLTHMAVVAYQIVQEAHMRVLQSLLRFLTVYT